MQILLEISDSNIPQGQDIIMVPIHFINGTVCEAGGHRFCIIPKGHGRLIDADRLMRVDHVILESQVDNAPTIIEADKEVQE